MSDRNVINGTAAVMISPIVDFYAALLPFLGVAAVLILADLRFGVEAAHRRKEAVRTSRMWRRTINKLVDYICWITLAGAIGGTFGEILGIPTLSALIILVIYAIELSSCFSNYFEARGIRMKFNIWKFLGVKRISDAVEEEETEKKEDGTQ